MLKRVEEQPALRKALKSIAKLKYLRLEARCEQENSSQSL